MAGTAEGFIYPTGVLYVKRGFILAGTGKGFNFRGVHVGQHSWGVHLPRGVHLPGWVGTIP